MTSLVKNATFENKNCLQHSTLKANISIIKYDNLMNSNLNKSY